MNCRRSFYQLNSPPVGVAVVLSQGEGSPSQSVTLDLTISLVVDPSSLTIKADDPSTLIQTEVDNRPAEEATTPSESQITTESSRAAVAFTSKPLLPLTDCLPVDGGAPSPLTAEISSAERALRDTSKVMETMNIHESWRNACAKIEWVMDVVSPIAEVRTLSIIANSN